MKKTTVQINVPSGVKVKVTTKQGERIERKWYAASEGENRRGWGVHYVEYDPAAGPMKITLDGEEADDGDSEVAAPEAVSA